MAWLTGCSLDDQYERGRGGSQAAVGASAGAGMAAGASSGGSPASGGFVNTGGTLLSSPSTINGGAGVDATTGAAAGGAGSSNEGTGSHAGSTNSTSTTTWSIACPAHNGTGGVLLTPPSNDFELTLGTWTRLAGDSGVSRVDGDGTACEGSGYLTCDGATRVGGGWDGPAIDVLPYMVPGHTYDVSAVIRFNPSSAPSAQRKVGLSQDVVCEDGIGKRNPVQHVLTTSSWARVRNATPLKFPPKGCLTVSRMRFYVETSEEEGSLSIDIDDFRLIDTTDSTGGAGGAGGAIAYGGSAGNAGAFASAGNGA